MYFIHKYYHYNGILSSVDLLTTKHLAVITDLGSGIEMIHSAIVEKIRNVYVHKHRNLSYVEVAIVRNLFCIFTKQYANATLRNYFTYLYIT